MPAEPGVYEARYGWTPLMGVAMAGDAAFVLAAVLLAMPLVMRVPEIAFFGYAGVVCLAYVVSKKIAIRADQSGVTLGGSPWRYRSTTSFFPWADITKIVVWQVDWPFILLRWTLFSVPIRYIGLQRRAGATPRPSRRSGRRLRT